MVQDRDERELPWDVGPKQDPTPTDFFECSSVEGVNFNIHLRFQCPYKHHQHAPSKFAIRPVAGVDGNCYMALLWAILREA